MSHAAFDPDLPWGPAHAAGGVAVGDGDCESSGFASQTGSEGDGGESDDHYDDGSMFAAHALPAEFDDDLPTQLHRGVGSGGGDGGGGGSAWEVDDIVRHTVYGGAKRGSLFNVYVSVRYGDGSTSGRNYIPAEPLAFSWAWLMVDG